MTGELARAEVDALRGPAMISGMAKKSRVWCRPGSSTSIEDALKSRV